MRRNAKTYIKSSVIGTLIGTIPGTGGVIAAFISYGEAKRSSRHPEAFGKGAEEGVIASEAANNAMVGGALVPTPGMRSVRKHEIRIPAGPFHSIPSPMQSSIRIRSDS